MRRSGLARECSLETIASEVGFRDGRVTRRFNCFYDTTAEAKVAKHLFIQGVNFFARKDV